MKHKVNKKLVTGIRRILKKIDVPIQEERDQTDGFYFYCDGVVISITDDDLVRLSYHVAARPDYASNVSLALCEVPQLEKIEIGDVFIVNKDSKVIFGDDAVKYHFESLKNNLIQDFMKDQYNKYILHTSKPYTC